LFNKVKNSINGFLDFFHRILFWWIPIQTYRYLACGGSNTILYTVLYHLTYFDLCHSKDVPLFGNVVIDVTIMAWIVAMSISFPLGFTLSRYVVFPESNLHGKIQLFRYAFTTVTFIVLAYLLLKAFEHFLGFVHPTVRSLMVNVIIAIISYVTQRIYTFKSVVVEETAMAE